jgi:hypothetical protein
MPLQHPRVAPAPLSRSHTPSLEPHTHLCYLPLLPSTADARLQVADFSRCIRILVSLAVDSDSRAKCEFEVTAQSSPPTPLGRSHAGRNRCLIRLRSDSVCVGHWVRVKKVDLLRPSDEDLRMMIGVRQAKRLGRSVRRGAIRGADSMRRASGSTPPTKRPAPHGYLFLPWRRGGGASRSGLGRLGSPAPPCPVQGAAGSSPGPGPGPSESQPPTPTSTDEGGVTVAVTCGTRPSRPSCTASQAGLIFVCTLCTQPTPSTQDRLYSIIMIILGYISLQCRVILH